MAKRSRATSPTPHLRAQDRYSCRTGDRPYHVIDEEILVNAHGEPFRGVLISVLAGALLWALLLASVWAVLR